MARRRARKRRARTKRPFPLSWLFLCFAVMASVGWLAKHQLLVPTIVVMGAAAIAALIWYLRRGIIENHRYRDLSRLQLLGPVEFERHVAEFYRRSGFRVKLTKRTGDQGIDVIADGRDGRIGICSQLMDALVLRHLFADDAGAPTALAKLVCLGTRMRPPHL